MSSIGSASFSMMNGLVDNAATVRQKLNTLTTQISSGRVSDSYAGLGAGAQVSLSVGPQIAHAQTWQANIDAASGNMQVTQTAMSQIQQIANSFYGQMPSLNNSAFSEIDSVAQQARSALQQVANLLDTRNGDTYVFAGQDSANPPVPNPDAILSSGFYTQVKAAVGGLAANGAAATAATTLALGTSNAAGTTPFSVYQSQPPLQIPNVQVGDSQRVTIALLAGANASVTSAGSSTTGSYMRDLMRSLATIGSLSSSQSGLGGFQGLISDTTSSLGSAITAMASDAGNLGNTQTSLAAIRTSLSDTVTALTAQVSSVQDVDMAAVLSQLQLVQTQMQSSYQLITNWSSMSLVKFL